MRSKADLILHPVRLRIIQVLLGREMTTGEIAQRMPDVPHATLYRHLRRLAQGNIVSVVAQSRVRGAIERTYAVALDQTVLTEDEVRRLDREDHMRLFMAFIASVTGSFERYLAQTDLDFVADGASYSQVTLHLDDDELRKLRAESAAMVQRALALGPGPGRRPRTLSSIVIPEPDTGEGRRSPRKKGESS